MPSSQILNLSPTSTQSANQDPIHPADSSTQMNDLVEQTRSDVRRMRLQLERQEDDYERQARRTKILSGILGLLLVALVVSAWFAYPSMQGQKKAALEMVGLQNLTGTLGEQFQSLEATFNKTTPALNARMDQLAANMKSNLQTARTQAQAAATQVGQKLRADFNQSVQAIQSRVAGIESNQRETSSHVNQLEQQIAGLKRDLATMQEESSAAAAKMAQLLQDEQRARSSELSKIDQRMGTQQTALDSVSNRVERKLVEFQVPNKRTEQVAQGIFLTIQRADVGKQEVEGTLQLGAESRMLNIRGQGIQKAFVFYTAGENRPIELVFTKVSKDQVSGYVVMPGSDTATTKAANGQ